MASLSLKILKSKEKVGLSEKLKNFEQNSNHWPEQHLQERKVFVVAEMP